MIRILIKQVVVYDDKIEIFYNFTSKNPDDNGQDFTLIKGSDNYPMVEVGRVFSRIYLAFFFSILFAR